MKRSMAVVVAAAVLALGPWLGWSGSESQAVERSQCGNAAAWWTATSARIDATWTMVDRGLPLLMLGVRMPNTFAGYAATFTVMSSDQEAAAWPAAADTTGVQLDARNLFYWWGRAFSEAAPTFVQGDIESGLATLDAIDRAAKQFVRTCGLRDG